MAVSVWDPVPATAAVGTITVPRLVGADGAPWDTSECGAIISDRAGGAFFSQGDSPRSWYPCAIYRANANGVVTLVAGDPAKGGFADGVGAAARFADVASFALGGLTPAPTQRALEALFACASTGPWSTPCARAAAAVLSSEAMRRRVASFVFPSTRGFLFASDVSNHRVRRIHLATGTVTTLAGSGEQGVRDGACAEARLAYPWGLALTRDGGTLYVSSGFAYNSDLVGDHRIRQIRAADGNVTTPAQEGPQQGDDPDFQCGLALSADERFLYVACERSVGRLALSDGAYETVADNRRSQDRSKECFNGIWDISLSEDGGTLFVGDFEAGNLKHVSTHEQSRSRSNVTNVTEGLGVANASSGPSSLFVADGGRSVVVARPKGICIAVVSVW